MPETEIKLKFEPRDLWIGVYWDGGHEGRFHWLVIYICVIPMLPIKIGMNWETRR